LVKRFEKAFNDKMNPEDYGVVVIGRNEGERLIRCLASVASESKNIVYVDSGSTDGSNLAAEKVGAHVVALNMNLPFTAARARNEGFAALKLLIPNMRFVQFIDGDCILVHGWLQEALGFMDLQRSVAIVCGRRRELYPATSVYNQLCDIEWDTPIGETTGCGGDSLVRVQAFEAVHGFQAQLIAGEEPEFCVRLRERGWKIWRLDADMTRHDAAMTRFGQFWSRAVRCGYAYAEVSRRHKSSPCSIWVRETTRAVIWGGVLPLIICLGAVIHPVALAGILVYFFQICRVAIARGPKSSEAWTYALFITLAKFAEFRGIVKYYWNQLIRRNTALIEYK
jgi:glycosyltransferase involved in cell wall biosynthesis